MGRKKEALDLGEKVYLLRNKLLGEDHPATIIAMFNLSHRYYEIGRKHEALVLLEKVHQLRNEILGIDHPDTIIVKKRIEYLNKI